MTNLKPALLLTLGATTLAACNAPPKPPAAKQKPTATVQVKTISLSQDASFLTAIGRVKNVRESMVSAKAMGRVEQVKVKSGDRVKQGQVLIRIDPNDARARLEQAQGGLAQARAGQVIAKQMLARFEALQKSDAASKAKHDGAVFDFQKAEGAVIQGQGAVRQAQAYLKETAVLAPFEGRIVDTMIEQGEMANPGMPLLKMESTDTLEFEATMNSQDVFGVKVGMPVNVIVDAARGEQREIEGKVTEIVPAQDRVTHSSLVRIDIGESDWIRSGMFGRAQFERIVGSCPGILVPADRLVTRGQLDAVYVVGKDDRVRLRLVKPGRTVGDQVEILSGLAEGDRLVTSDIKDLIDGQPAKVSS